jgi:hypothetical protein
VLVLVVGLAISAILVGSLSCTPAAPPHPAIGNWRSGFFSLIVYPDEVATINGFQCAWSSVDAATIRINPQAKIEIPVLGTPIEVALNFHVMDGGVQGMLDLAGIPLILDRDGQAQPASSKPMH